MSLVTKLTGSKDTDEHLLNLMSDDELLKVLTLNKDYKQLTDKAFKKRLDQLFPNWKDWKPEDMSYTRYYLGEQFFKKRLSERFPNWIKWKPENMNYRDYYLSLVYYVALLKEEYRLDFLPEFEGYPKYYYINLGNNAYFWFPYMIGKTGDINIVRKYENEIDNKDRLINGAVESGNVDLVKYLGEEIHLNHYALAIESKNPDMIEYVRNQLEGEFSNLEMYDKALSGYLNNGDLEEVKRYIELIREIDPDYDVIYSGQGLGLAAESGNLDLLKYLLDKYEFVEEDVSSALFFVILENYTDIIKYLVERYPEYRESFIEVAQRFDREDLVLSQNI